MERRSTGPSADREWPRTTATPFANNMARSRPMDVQPIKRNLRVLVAPAAQTCRNAVDLDNNTFDDKLAHEASRRIVCVIGASLAFCCPPALSLSIPLANNETRRQSYHFWYGPRAGVLEYCENACFFPQFAGPTLLDQKSNVLEGHGRSGSLAESSALYQQFPRQ